MDADREAIVERIREVAPLSYDGTDPDEIADAILALLPSLGYVKTGEWAEDYIQYGHLLDIGIFMPEYKGKNYALHQRRVMLGVPVLVPVPNEGDTDE